MSEDFDWSTNTDPFTTLGGRRPARFRLQQVSDNQFSLQESFRFTSPVDAGTYDVTPAMLPESDIASIPGYLGWFARRHGRHTPAALVHDQRINARPDAPSTLRHDLRVAADLEFRFALGASGVPPVRRWLMWAGVSAATRWHSDPRGRAGMVAWGVAALLGTALLIYGASTGTWWLVALASVAPIGGSALWGRQYKAGLVGGYAVWMVILGSLPARVAYLSYQVVEWIVSRVAKVFGNSVPGPTPHGKR